MKGLLNVLPGEGRDEAGIDSGAAASAGALPPPAGPEPVASGGAAVAVAVPSSVSTAAVPAAANAAAAPAAVLANPVRSEAKAPEEAAAEGVKGLISGHGVAVLTLSEVGEILSAQGCSAVFGCEGAALAGQNIRVLLKGGLDNDVGRFLHRQHAGKSSPGSSLIRVIALRKDGTEFPASITTVVLNSDTTLKAKSDVSRFWWTAFIRDMASASEAGSQNKAISQENGPFAADFFRLQESHSALEKANEELQKQLQEVSTDLIRMPEGSGPPAGDLGLEELRAAAAKAETLLQQQLERGNHLEEELAALRVNDGASAAKLPHRQVEELENQLRQALDELDSVKATALDRSQSPLFTEVELRVQLDAARQASEQAETALKEEVARNEKLEERFRNLASSLKVEQAERSKRFEAELRALREERDDLDQRLAAEQQSTAGSVERAAELEGRLAQNAAEVDRARAEMEAQAEERQRCESAWREQLDTAFIKKKEVEGAWAGELERNKSLEEELAKLRHERDDLSGKLLAEQQATQDSRQRAKEVESRLGRNAAEVERAQSQLGRQSAARTHAETELRQELEAAKARRRKLETDWTEAQERNRRLEAELTDLRQQRDDLDGRLTAEQQAAAELRRQAEELQSQLGENSVDLEKRRAEKERCEARWREQLESVKAQKKELETAWAGAVERTMQCEEELAGLRRERDELKGRQNAQQIVGTEFTRRAEDLEARLRANLAELARAKEDLQKQNVEREQMETEWRGQIETARALAKKLETAWTGAAERNKRFEAELATLRQEREELKIKLGAGNGNGITMKPARRSDELENKLTRAATELAQLKAELDREKSARQRAEIELRKQVEAAKCSATKRLTATAKPAASAPAAPTSPSSDAGSRLGGDLGQLPPSPVRYKLAP